MDDATPERLHATITGRVHGVGFRYFVLREAMDLGLVGWVANQPDGTVSCEAEGSRANLDRLLEALREGPPAAIVDDVRVMWRPPSGQFASFEIRSGAHRGD